MPEFFLYCPTSEITSAFSYLTILTSGIVSEVFPCADAPAGSKLAFSFAYVLLSSFSMSVCQVIKSPASFKPLSVSFPLELPKPTQSKRSNTCFKCEPDPVNV